MKMGINFVKEQESRAAVTNFFGPHDLIRAHHKISDPSNRTANSSRQLGKVQASAVNYEMRLKTWLYRDIESNVFVVQELQR